MPATLRAATCWAVCVGLASIVPAAEVSALPLRLVGAVDGHDFDQVVVEKYELRVRAADGTTHPIARGTRWRLEGDLWANQGDLCFSPDYSIANNALAPSGLKLRPLSLAIIPIAKRWPWRHGVDGDILVFLWLVEGRPVEVKPVPVISWNGPSDDFLGIGEFDLREETRDGAPVVLLFRNQQAVPPEAAFASPEANQALAAMHLGSRAEFNDALGAVHDIDTISKRDRQTLLHFAAELGRRDRVEDLLAANASADRTDRRQEYPLELAAGNGRETTVKALIDLEGKRNRRGSEALERALDAGRLGLAATLLPENPRGLLGSLLERAVQRGDTALVQSLLARGGGPLMIKLSPGVVAGGLAVGDPELTQLLLSSGVAADQAIEGTPLLLYAMAGRSSESVKAWVQAGARIDRGDRNGTTALMVAACMGDVAIVETLLSLEANVTLRDRLGQSALDYAFKAHHDDIVRLLQAHGSPSESVTAESERDSRQRAEILHPWIDADEPVFAESEVDVRPEIRTAEPVDFRSEHRQQILSFAQTSVVANAQSGQIFQYTAPMRTASVSVPTSDFWAVASVVVEKDGRPGFIAVHEGPTSAFRAAAQDALMKYKFLRGERGGKPVRTRVTIVVTGKP